MTRIPAAERREALVRAAMRVVAVRGIAGTTTRAIVAEAGMSLASFHYAFESRDELIAELIDHVNEQEERSIEPAFLRPAGTLTMRDAIRGGLQYYFEALRADPMREAAMLELTQYAMRSPELHALARRQYDRYFQLAERALAVAASHSGDVWARPLSEVAVLLVSLTDGLTMSWLVNRDDAAAASVMDFAAESVAGLAMSTAPTPQATTPQAPTPESTAELTILRNA